MRWPMRDAYTISAEPGIYGYVVAYDMPVSPFSSSTSTRLINAVKSDLLEKQLRPLVTNSSLLLASRLLPLA